MKRKFLPSSACVLSLLLLVAGTCALAQERGPLHFKGLLNDYTPANPLIAGSPYEMHGQWSLDLHEWGELADFAADMTMSDYGTTNNVLDATKGGQNAHTHHIRLTHAKVTWDMTGCPAYPKPFTTRGFQVTGTVSMITGNGSGALFETTPPSSMLQVCITGGTEVPYSNMTMVFTGPATNHFGNQAIHGVVRKLEPASERW
ncbi:hypothetical protein RBB79_10825 [Tunturiibacter empetritectus]|uniref:Uncharacterized protein n=1 Tax=Tunturiibacter lichenicola TaxID=2051959 RepID=A0A852VGB2_9BACT|nr:hypothetical protein [Edaphobacter lichenicola]NYF90059.1 hypothetical protein [Edaphobacter lichenicola]